MAFSHPLSNSTPIASSNAFSTFTPRHFPSITTSLTLLSSPNSHVRDPCLVLSARQQSPLTSEQTILEAIAGSEADERSLPVVRTFENDLARLSLVGAVDFKQALTAAAADGGEAADEHISSGVPAMVVETVFPGHSDEHSTVSTRLFLPTRKVKEKAMELRKSLTKDILASTTSKNILAMTFRQVVLQQLWNLELVVFTPGTERNMDNLENPREVLASFVLSSSDEQVISLIAQVVCRAALESTEMHFLDHSLNRTSNQIFHWFNKSEKIVSKNSAVVLYNLIDHEILANAKNLLGHFNSGRAKCKLTNERRLRNRLWTSLAYSKLEKIGGPEFCAWISEYIPSYKLLIDTSKFKDIKLEGRNSMETNSFEVLLTQSQMLSLADILDMYYEDVFTLPGKQLSCGALARSSKPILSKGISLLKLFSIALASGLFLVAISILSKLYLPHKLGGRRDSQANHTPQSFLINCVQHQSLESSKLEDYYISLLKRIRDSFGWTGDIVMDPGRCAWTGELPACLRKLDETESGLLDISAPSVLSKGSDEEMKASLQDIASYQVVLSTDGHIVGFQPTSRVAVNHWAANPLAKELYGVKDLSPGLLEPGVKTTYPNEVMILELLMSVNPDTPFALVRPLNISS